MRQTRQAPARLVLLEGGDTPEAHGPDLRRERVLDLWESVVAEAYAFASFVNVLVLTWLLVSALSGNWEVLSLWKVLICPAMAMPLAHVMAGAATGAGAAARESLEHAIELISRAARYVRSRKGR